MSPIRRLFAFLSIVMGIAGPAFGARFPNAIERTMVLRGENAALFGKLLGLSSSNRSKVQVQLGMHDAWAVYLLKKDTPKELSNPDEGMPQRYNSIEFSPSAVPSLVIGPYWLDEGTRRPDSKKGRYSFHSPTIVTSRSPDDAWSHLVDTLRSEPSWNQDPKVAFQRSLVLADGARLVLQVWHADVSSYVVGISVEGVDR